jgi:hypothetical protein
VAVFVGSNIMKYQFDLLPEEYKSSPRDTIGIVFAVIAIIITIASICTTMIKNKASFSGIDKQIAKEKASLAEIYRNTSNENPNANRINEVKKSIEFINKNLDTPATDVVVFLNSLEGCVPDSVILKDLNPKKLNTLNVKFTINGEASTIQDILEFTNRLNRSGKFKASLRSNQSAVVAERIVQNFILEFQYKPSPNN